MQSLDKARLKLSDFTRRSIKIEKIDNGEYDCLNNNNFAPITQKMQLLKIYLIFIYISSFKISLYKEQWSIKEYTLTCKNQPNLPTNNGHYSHSEF